MRNRSRNKNNIKDYIVPIITFALIFILIFISFSWWNDKKSEDTKSNDIINNSKIKSNALTLQLWDIDTQATIIKENKEKIKAINNSNFIPWEIVAVNKWYVSFDIPSVANFSLNWNKELWSIEYLENWDIQLNSSSLWIKTITPITVKLKFWEINIWENSIVNLKQNEVLSSFYLIQWSAEVKNKWNVSSFLSPWKKIEISNKNSLKEDIDLNTLKSDFDSYFKISDWTLLNNWKKPLDDITIENLSKTNNLLENNNSNSGSLDKQNKTITTSNTLLNFDWIYDEWFVDTAITNISWNFIDEEIASITINWKSANINMEKKTFNVIWVDTSKKINDLIVKVYNSSNDLIWKSVLTLNYQSGKNNSNTNLFSKINTKPYPVNISDFIISIPKVKDWKTFSDEITFFWTVKNPNVKIVKINWFQLKTYNWRTFRYHAYKRFKTLWEWVNNYKIEYIWQNWNIILVQYKTIEKLSKNNIPKKRISWEAQ